MKRASRWTALATMGPIGYLPLPGTMGSLASMGVIYIFSVVHMSVRWYTLWTIIAFFGAVYIINRALDELERGDDPSEIVIDELVGILVTFWGIKLTLGWAVVGFFLFRVFDISKVGIMILERVRGGLGIVFDDVAAGILSNIVLQVLIYYS